MRKYLLALTILISILLALPFQPALAQGDEEPIAVRAVLFFSPTCGHCAQLIQQDLPPIAEKYKENLQLVGIDVSQEGGSMLFQAAIERFNVPDDRMGVPMLVINDTVLVGGVEIPEQFPPIIEAVLSSGGNDWPDIPGLKEAINASQNGANAQDAHAASTATDSDQPLFISAFLRDLVGNSIAVLTLLLMLVVIAIVVVVFIKAKPLKIMQGPTWVILLLSLLGIFIAGYLSFVEVTKTQAICGPIGDCNTVQQSRFATLFGILPVGVLGLLGYLAIIAAWLAWRFGPQNIRKLAIQAIWGMSWFGIIFSIYLTFLEPFVIGATCAWCISSALVMTLIFWFATGWMKEIWESEDEDEVEFDDNVEYEDNVEHNEA